MCVSVVFDWLWGRDCRSAEGHQLQDPTAVHRGWECAGRAEQRHDQEGQVHLQVGTGAVAVPNSAVHCRRAAVRRPHAGGRNLRRFVVMVVVVVVVNWT